MTKEKYTKNVLGALTLIRSSVINVIFLYISAQSFLLKTAAINHIFLNKISNGPLHPSHYAKLYQLIIKGVNGQ